MATLVIDVKGGVVQEVYTDIADVRVVLVDWDNIEGGDTGVEYPTAALTDMDDETRAQVDGALRET